jgi:hypothetical protein
MLKRLQDMPIEIVPDEDIVRRIPEFCTIVAQVRVATYQRWESRFLRDALLVTTRRSQKAAAEEHDSVIVIGRILARLLEWEQLDGSFAHPFVVEAGLDALRSCASTSASTVVTEEAICVLLQWMNKLTGIRLAPSGLPR